MAACRLTMCQPVAITGSQYFVTHRTMTVPTCSDCAQKARFQQNPQKSGAGADRETAPFLHA